MNELRLKLQRWWCAKRKHGELQVIEEYSREESLRHYLMTYRPIYYPHVQIVKNAKWRCVRCGTIGMGPVYQRRHLTPSEIS